MTVHGERIETKNLFGEGDIYFFLMPCENMAREANNTIVSIVVGRFIYNIENVPF